MNPETIEVPDGIVKANFPDTLEARMGPCLVIAVYDPITKSGYMIHEAAFTEQGLDSYLKIIQEDYGDLSRVKVFATGNMMRGLDEIERNIGVISSSVAEALIEKYFEKSKTTIRWMLEKSCTLYLHLLTGKFELDTSPSQ